MKTPRVKLDTVQLWSNFRRDNKGLSLFKSFVEWQLSVKPLIHGQHRVCTREFIIQGFLYTPSEQNEWPEFVSLSPHRVETLQKQASAAIYKHLYKSFGQKDILIPTFNGSDITETEVYREVHTRQLPPTLAYHDRAFVQSNFRQGLNVPVECEGSRRFGTPCGHPPLYCSKLRVEFDHRVFQRLIFRILTRRDKIVRKEKGTKWPNSPLEHYLETTISTKIPVEFVTTCGTKRRKEQYLANKLPYNAESKQGKHRYSKVVWREAILQLTGLRVADVIWPGVQICKAHSLSLTDLCLVKLIEVIYTQRLSVTRSVESWKWDLQKFTEKVQKWSQIIPRRYLDWICTLPEKEVEKWREHLKTTVCPVFDTTDFEYPCAHKRERWEHISLENQWCVLLIGFENHLSRIRTYGPSLTPWLRRGEEDKDILERAVQSQLQVAEKVHQRYIDRYFRFKEQNEPKRTPRKEGKDDLWTKRKPSRRTLRKKKRRRVARERVENQ